MTDKLIETARHLIAAQCDTQDMTLRAQLYRNGSNDDQPELKAMVKLLASLRPRPLDELLTEDEI